LAGYRIQEGIGGLFSTLRLGVEIGDQSISVASLDATGIDSPEVVTDSDADGTSDGADQCDNSLVVTRANGCAEQVVVPLGYAAVAQVFVAGDDTFRTLRDETLVIQLEQLLANDSAGPRDAPTIRSVSSAEHGAVELGDERHVFYDPPKGFLGTDTFTYTIGDRRARNATARVSVEVVSSLAPLPAEAIVYFASNSLKLVAESGRRLDELAQQLRGHPRVRIEVRGYTDARGSSAYNLRLSKWRAESIEKLLVGHGIDAARIEARGMGEESQDADNADATVQQRGRRAELRFIIPNDS
jgi:outer membrane protein OmpA-like peptidoglycan-associated protein